MGSYDNPNLIDTYMDIETGDLIIVNNSTHTVERTGNNDK